MLKFPPIKPVKITNTIIYRTKYEAAFNITRQIARLISLKDGKMKAEAEFYPSFSLRGEEVEKSVFVSTLYSYIKHKGYGTKLLNYIKQYSKQIGFGGNFFLVSSPWLTPQRSPHPFYRKYGMTSDDIKIDKLIDKFIRKNKPMTHKNMGNVTMFYPARKPPETSNIFKRIWRKLFF